jgi:hypothetical protein
MLSLDVESVFFHVPIHPKHRKFFNHFYYTWSTCRVQKGKELNDFQRNPLDIGILSNLRFGSLEIRDTSVTRVTNNFYLRAVISDCLLIGFIRATETLRKN